MLWDDFYLFLIPCCLLFRNTFVLEYCGEVLDHKEFKTRVKEYARNKNIHYYFMSLKNNEVSKYMSSFQTAVGFNGSGEVIERNTLHYVLSLQIIDATLKGNCSRFMNHSCEPNCETQKVQRQRKSFHHTCYCYHFESSLI